MVMFLKVKRIQSCLYLTRHSKSNSNMRKYYLFLDQSNPGREQTVNEIKVVQNISQVPEGYIRHKIHLVISCLPFQGCGPLLQETVSNHRTGGRRGFSALVSEQSPPRARRLQEEKVLGDLQELPRQYEDPHQEDHPHRH